MVTKRATTEVSADKLLEAASQLSLPELGRFVAEVTALHTQRRVPKLPRTEADLLNRINGGMPTRLHKRYWVLIRKRQNETITEEEYSELLRLTDIAEQVQVERLEALIELASLRKVSLDDLMKSLGIKPPPVE